MSEPRMIRVNSCQTCPNRDHKGGFGSPAYVPVCRKAGQDLPYTLHPNSRGTGCMAHGTHVIPDWCPLDKIPN